GWAGCIGKLGKFRAHRPECLAGYADEQHPCFPPVYAADQLLPAAAAAPDVLTGFELPGTGCGDGTVPDKLVGKIKGLRLLRELDHLGCITRAFDFHYPNIPYRPRCAI